VVSKNLSAVAVLLVLTLSWIPKATGPAAMTLEDCIHEALEINLTVLDGEEAVTQARDGIVGARSGFLPNLSVRGSYNFAEKLATLSIPTATDTCGFATMDVEADFTKDYDFNLELIQPVYTGGALTGSYNIAKYSYRIAHADLESRQSAVTLQVIEAFYGLLLARESVKVTEQSLETAEEFLRIVKARYETGEASSFEVLRAEVEVSNLKPALIGARNAVALSELALKNAMSVDAGKDIIFVGSLEREAFEVELEEALGTAFDNRAEMRITGIQKEIAFQSIKLAKAGRLPSVSISANYNVRSDKLTLDNDRLEKTYAGYLVFSLPLFDGLRTKSAISQSYSQLRQAEIGAAGLEDAIELEVRSSLLEIEAAFETLKSQEKSVEMAEEGLEIANARYMQGYATNLEVMDSQLALTRARNNRIQALHDVNRAIARAKKAMGVLLRDYKLGAR
jgi:outer membrane protein TolC